MLLEDPDVCLAQGLMTDSLRLSSEVIAVSGKTHLSHTQRCHDGRDHLLFGRCQTEKGQRLSLNLKDYTVYPEGLEV